MQWLELALRAAAALPTLMALMKRAEVSLTSNETAQQKVEEVLEDLEAGLMEIEHLLDGHESEGNDNG